MHSLEKLPEYFGREHQKTLLWRYSRRAVDEPRSFAIHFEAAGGLGKTRLLELYPYILRAAPRSTQEHLGNLRVAQIVDFYSFESRDPNVVEQRLISGLKQTDAGEWYRLPPDVVDDHFAMYTQALREYRQARESRDEAKVETSIRKLRQTFVTCWNHLAATYPLVMRFDTLETLFVLPAPPDALSSANAGAAGLDVILAWMREILPQLQHTLVLLSGRPVEENNLVRELERLGLMIEPVQRLEPFVTPEEIHAYLLAYGCKVEADQISYIQNITAGRPLLLTCYAETLRSTSAIPPGLPDLPSPEKCNSRAEFEDWLISTLLDPMQLTLPNELGQITLSYCLYFLVYARRGLRRAELAGLFEELGLPYDQRVIDLLGQVALVKSTDDLLFLHDEIFTMIDESGKPKEYGMLEPTLDHLCAISRARVQDATERSVLIGAMADNMYYELTRDFQTGYRIYRVYTDQLLVERGVNAVLALSDAFWRTLNYPIRRNPDQAPSFPYRNALAESGVTEDEILRDERVGQVLLLLARDQNNEARSIADELHDRLVREGYLPPDSTDILSAASRPKDPYLFVTMNLWRAYAIDLAELSIGSDRAEQLFSRIISFLEETDLINEEFLCLRRLYFLGHAYNLRGYLRRQHQRYHEARHDYERSRSAFKRYRSEQITYKGQTTTAERLYNDRIANHLAQTTNNLAYILSLIGNLKRSELLSDEVVREHLRYTSDYQKALFYNTNGLIKIRRGAFLQAEVPLKKAQEWALASGSTRALGLVAQARGLLLSAMMHARLDIDQDIEQHFHEAIDLLRNEPDSQREVYYDWAGYARVLGFLLESAADTERAKYYQQRTLDLFGEALRLLPKDRPTMQLADLIESQATVYNDMGQYEEARALLDRAEEMMSIPMPEYGQVVSGKIAFQRAIIALYHDKDPQRALQLMKIGLARMYLFAPEHLDQGNLERAVEQLTREITNQELISFQQMPAQDQTQVALEDLFYQQPTPDNWSSAWERAATFMDNSITAHLDV
jgi:hypothetical protein